MAAYTSPRRRVWAGFSKAQQRKELSHEQKVLEQLKGAFETQLETLQLEEVVLKRLIQKEMEPVVEEQEEIDDDMQLFDQVTYPYDINDNTNNTELDLEVPVSARKRLRGADDEEEEEEDDDDEYEDDGDGFF